MTTCVIVAFATILSATSFSYQKALTLPDEPPFENLYINNWTTPPVDATAMARIVRRAFAIEDFAPLTVPEIRAMDLDGDGSNELVTAPDQGCSGCPALLVVFNRDDRQVQAWMLHTEWGDIERDVADVNEDGIPEVQTRDWIPTSLSHAESIFWPHFHNLKDGRLILSDRLYKAHYRMLKEEWQERQRKVLAETPESVAIREGKDRSWSERYIRNRTASFQAGIDKVDRFLGNKKAGFKHAVDWWNSGDKELQHMAIVTFGEIRDATCMGYLEQAVGNADKYLADEVKSALGRRKGK